MSNYKTLKTYWGCGNKIFTENFKNKEYLPKIAVYAYNFGNFRNELDSDINKNHFFSLSLTIFSIQIRILNQIIGI